MLRRGAAAASAVWNLLVRHHGGSLEEIGRRTRRLPITLRILAGSPAPCSRARCAHARAVRERLRLQQLEFVAGVTHELNTPVAALTSAGQNLADGIITEPSQVSRYGTAIVKESRRLTEMIGQVLAYGGMESRRKLPHVPVDVANVIDEAVAACRWMAEEQSIAIETDIDRALPLVDGDAASLARAVQNLIANAIRHGAAGKWVAIRAVGRRAQRRDFRRRPRSRNRGARSAASVRAVLSRPRRRSRSRQRTRTDDRQADRGSRTAAACRVDKRRDGGASSRCFCPALHARAGDRASMPEFQRRILLVEDEESLSSRCATVSIRGIRGDGGERRRIGAGHRNAHAVRSDRARRRVAAEERLRRLPAICASAASRRRS